jgi:ATP-binding protein involved in chromosome partitioning
VIENMAYLPCPHCDERIEVFGKGGGHAVAQALSRLTGADVPVLGEIPIDLRLREAGDDGVPLVLSEPEAPAAAELLKIARSLGRRSRSLAGRPLGLTPV